MRNLWILGVATAFLGSTAVFAELPGDGRSNVEGLFHLDLEGVPCGEIQKFEGGDIEAAVVNLPMAHDYYTKKHLGSPKYNDFTVQIGAGMCPQVYAWLQAMVEGKPVRKSGAITLSDFNYREREVREFQNALITEISIPALDGASKDAGYLKVTFQPETIRIKQGSGRADRYPPSKHQKMWSPANFRLSLDGVETRRISKIESFTIKQGIAKDDVGTARDYEKEPGKIEFPDLTVRLPDSASEPFRGWFDSFVIQGKNDDAQEKEGAIAFQDQNGRDLIVVELHNVGIFKGSAVAGVNDDDKLRYRASLYVERMGFKFSPDLFAKNSKTTGKKGERMPASVPAKKPKTQH